MKVKSGKMKSYQFFANIYLNELDHFTKDTLGFVRYLRYVDDFIILRGDKGRLREAVDEVDRFLNEVLHLYLCKEKTILQPTERGIDLLGYFIKPIYTLVRQKVVKRFKDKLYKRRSPDDGLFRIEDIPMIQSYLGHFSYTNSFNLRRKLGE